MMTARERIHSPVFNPMGLDPVDLESHNWAPIGDLKEATVRAAYWLRHHGFRNKGLKALQYSLAYGASWRTALRSAFHWAWRDLQGKGNLP